MISRAWPTRNRHVAQIAAVLSLAIALPVVAADWPQWRGPNRDGISTETGWAISWPSNGLKQVWKAEVGTGFGAVSVSKGRLYVLGNTSDKDTVYCLNAGTGEGIWQFSYDCAAKDPNGYHGTRSTPTVDGELVFTTSRQGHMFCLGAADGKVKWSKEFGKDFGGKTPTWGFAMSPLVEGGLVILEPGGPEASVVAFKKETGEEVWRSGSTPAAYSSPVAYTMLGERGVAVFGARGGTGYRVSDGKELWSFPWKTAYDVNAATPIVHGTRVFVSSGYNAGCGLYEVGSNPPQAVWSNKNMRNHVNSCVLWKGFLYGFDERSLKCLDVNSGEVKWAETKYGKGSLMVADGKLLLYSERGQLGLAEATPDGYQELAFVQALQVRTSYPGGAAKQTWAAPVLANGKVYCRSHDDLVCLDLQQSPGAR